MEKYVLKQNGEIKFTGTMLECMKYLHKLSGQSADYAMKNQGFELNKAE